jgi:formate hydrogenlyase subunit 3/multisubunit Na+/H+ antiporter MnhD subunit
MIALTLACILLLLGLAVAGAFVAGLPRGRNIVYGGSLAISFVLLLIALVSLSAEPSDVTLPLGLPWTGAHFCLDPLAAFFLVVIGLGSAGASLYALGYGKHELESHRVLPFYPAFLAGLNLVVVAADAFSFLFAWELMSLASWALVMSHHRESKTLQAGYVYIVMASFSGLALLLCFGLLAGPTGSYTFVAMRAAHLSPGIIALAMVLALIGAGSKAGVVPLHAWLPLAHPAAPSHVSALMSGVMTKVAVYCFIRIAFDLLGTPTSWSAIAVLAIGGVTAVLGVLYALMEHDLKRLLAYHTVENIGIIFIGLGLALAFGANHLPTAAALGLTAALFHVFNHSVFKSLLFFGTGAVLTATGERDMDHLGGLIHRMPKTALTFLVGSVAISALPPLNGFVSEWLTFQAILLRPDLPQWGLRLAIPADGALLALSAALAAACFVKAFGITFLGRPRTRVAADAREVDGFSHTAMFGFAGLCLLVGIFPGAVIDLLAPVTRALTGTHMPTQLGVAWLSIVPIESARSSYNGLLVFVFITLSASLAALAIHRLASHALRRAPAWDCGFPDPRPETQYTGASFAQPIRRVYGSVVFRARETVIMPPPGDIAPARIEKRVNDVIWDVFYAPVAGAVWRASEVLNALQFLTIRRYLGFVFATLVILLLALALWP